MKGNENLLTALNDLLADELTATMQYVVHAEMCDNWGYERLHKKIKERAIQEMKHAEKLIERILFLEGTPRVDKLNKVSIGKDISQQLAGDLASEMTAVRGYNEAIKLADEVRDAVSRTLLEAIVEDEDDHVDWIEEQQDQIAQMGLPMYLGTQTED
jgi:bacterioferritin